jgi:bis(5'-nucleosyl)-tetraphosphatase (symmetrical)
LSHFAIGDVQGCARSLNALLDKIPGDAQLFFCGDLVNRGPRSLEALDIMMNLGSRAKFVLGNHDLHFLAATCGARKPSKSDTLNELLNSSRLAEYVNWLRRQSLALSFFVQRSTSPTSPPTPLNPSGLNRHLLVHAGVLPNWTADQTQLLADEVSDVLQGQTWQAMMHAMYSNQPSLWSDELAGMDRWRLIINALTRARFVYENGTLELESKEGPASRPKGTLPWFDHPERKTADDVVVFGHWSTLGLVNRRDVIGLDTGCVWGGKLTAMELETRRIVQVDNLD